MRWASACQDEVRNTLSAYFLPLLSSLDSAELFEDTVPTSSHQIERPVREHRILRLSLPLNPRSRRFTPRSLEAYPFPFLNPLVPFVSKRQFALVGRSREFDASNAPLD